MSAHQIQSTLQLMGWRGWQYMEYPIGYMKVLHILLFRVCVVTIFNLEEVLASNYALWWAPDGEHIVYAVFNDSVVQDFNFPIYGHPDNVYTDIVSIAYPKVRYILVMFKYRPQGLY